MSANSANDSTETYAHHYCPQNVSEQIRFSWYFAFETRYQACLLLLQREPWEPQLREDPPTLHGLGSPRTSLNTVSAVLRCSLQLAGHREAREERKSLRKPPFPLWLLREENLSLFAQPAPLQFLPRPREWSCLCLIYSRSLWDHSPKALESWPEGDSSSANEHSLLPLPTVSLL